MTGDRREDLIRFYALLDKLEKSIGGARTLASCSARMSWPRRGVYFFREPGEIRSDTGIGPRIVRVGTHALKDSAGTKLWSRLAQHKGRQRSGGGNHRGSVFRQIVGAALIGRDSYDFPTWGRGNSAPGEIRAGEHDLECAVSRVIGEMPFLWLSICDEPGPYSRRGYIEQNSIALLSNYRKAPLDPPSPGWLGRYCNRELVKSSGLWNSDHVNEHYEPAFLDELKELVAAAGGGA